MNRNSLLLLAAFFLVLFSCNNPQTLPILGNREAVERVVDGKTVVDTIYATVPNFSFVNQDSLPCTQENLKGKIYVADFFFTTCPTICPIMKKQMLRVYEKVKGDETFMLISHTIDPEHDTVALLKDYSTRLKNMTAGS